MNPLVAIVGPTATGKSSLALELCQALNGEIISADSRQVYRYMDIGTAKPTKEERALVPHHLIDVADPDEDFSLALYQSKALETIDDIQRRGRCRPPGMLACLYAVYSLLLPVPCFDRGRG